MDRQLLIQKMQGRVDMCRRLARSTTDQRAADMLRQIADEGEADIRRLLGEDTGYRSNAEEPNPRPEPGA